MKNRILYLLLVVLLSSCHNSKEAVKLRINKFNPPVILRYNLDRGYFYWVQYPFSFEVTNNSSSSKTLSVSYFYNNPEKSYDPGERRWISGGQILFVQEKGEPIRVGLLEGGNKDIVINPSQTRRYIVYSKHTIDSTQASQQLFAPYLERAKSLNQKEIKIENLQDFKLKHPDIVNTFLQGDSIEFLFRSATKKEPMIQILWPVDTDDEKEMEYIYNVF